MPLDALCLSGIVHELNTALAGSKIDKIYQPGREDVYKRQGPPTAAGRLRGTAVRPADNSPSRRH